MLIAHRFRTCLLPLGLLLGCSDRKAEPDYSELFAEACEVACPVTTECVSDPVYASTEECSSTCTSLSPTDDLNQCQSRRLEFNFCVGMLTCDEYNQYLMTLEDANLPLPPDFKCTAELEATYTCDPSLPFEPPDR